MAQKTKDNRSFILICVTLSVLILFLIITLMLVMRAVGQKSPASVTVTDTKADEPTAVITTTEPKSETDKPITDAPVTEPVTKPVTEPVIVTEPVTTEGPKVPVVPVDTEPASSGGFYSDNEQKLKLYVEWNSTRNESGDKADIRIKVYVQCYSLDVGARIDNKITVNGKSYGFVTQKINEHYSKPTKILLADKTVSVDLTDNDAVELSASWNFKGVYSDVQIDYLEASDVVVIK